MFEFNQFNPADMPFGVVPLPANETITTFSDESYLTGLKEQQVAMEARAEAAGPVAEFAISAAFYDHFTLLEAGISQKALANPASIESIKLAFVEPTKVETVYQGTYENFLAMQTEQRIIAKAAAERAEMAGSVETKGSKRKKQNVAGSFIGSLLAPFLSPQPTHA